MKDYEIKRKARSKERKQFGLFLVCLAILLIWKEPIPMIAFIILVPIWEGLSKIEYTDKNDGRWMTPIGRWLFKSGLEPLNKNDIRF